MLNYIWASFFIAAAVAAVIQTLGGDPSVWTHLVEASFASARSAFEIALSLTGMLCLWLGLLKIAAASGITEWLARALNPFFRRIMPEVPADSPAMGSMIMNMAANMLGLDNAATPMGIKAMEQLQAANPHPDRASNAQILFMVINSSAVTLIPVTILMYRAQLGAANPSAVFVPILLATSVSTAVGFLSVAYVQKLPLFNKVVLSYLAVFFLLIAGLALYFAQLPPQERLQASAVGGNFILFAMMTAFILAGLWRRINVFDTFIEGAKEGFDIAVRIIPYLVAMLVAIAVLRASGLLDSLVAAMAAGFDSLGIDSSFTPALPTALLKPLSGSGARAMMIETMQTYGVDSFPAFVSAVVQGSTETTFYVLAVYFGAVRISRVGAALPCALLADLAGIIAAVAFSYLFY